MVLLEKNHHLLVVAVFLFAGLVLVKDTNMIADVLAVLLLICCACHSRVWGLLGLLAVVLFSSSSPLGINVSMIEGLENQIHEKKAKKPKRIHEPFEMPTVATSSVAAATAMMAKDGFVGGGVDRIDLSQNLRPKMSNSIPLEKNDLKKRGSKGESPSPASSHALGNKSIAEGFSCACGNT